VPACESLDIETMCARFSGEIVLGGEFGVVVLSADLRILHQSRPSWLPVISLAADAAAGIYAGTLGDGLYRSIDDGLTWTHLGLEGEEITGIVPSDEDFCFVATRTHGIFETRDGGRQWHAYGEGLRSEEILDLHAGYDGFLYAGTVAGVAKSALPVLTARYLAPDFTLSQSSPNPAIGTATFSWSVPRAGKVRMSIYDILGRQQRVIFDRLETAGLFSENVDTGGLLSGTYFCVLGFEGNMLVEKFQVLR
jgi:ligand-binding sensor domain-containing protein